MHDPARPAAARAEISARGGWDPAGSRFSVPAIVALALALRATMALRTSVIFEDGPHFLEIAGNFARGDWAGALSHPYHPLYPALTALANVIVNDGEAAALVVSVLAGTAAVLASYVFMRDAFGPRAATVGAFLLAISPYAVRFTSDVQSEGVYLAFFVTGLALLWKGLAGQAGVRFFLGAGICAGLAYLTRPEAAGLVPIGMALIALRWFAADWRLDRAASACAALGTGALAVAAPYLFLLASREGGVVLSGKKSVLRTLGLSGEPAGWLATDLVWTPLSALLAIALIGSLATVLARFRGPGRARRSSARAVRLAGGLALLAASLLLWPAQLAEFAGVAISTLRPEVAALVAVGLFALRSRGTQPRDAFIATILVCYGAVLMGLLVNYGYLSRRHVLPLLPLVLGYAGLGAVWLVDRIALARPRWAGALAPGGLLACLALLMLGIAAPKALHDHREDALAQRLAAEWLRDRELGAGGLAANKRRSAYYAGRRWTPLREAGKLRSLESLHRERVRYIVVDAGSQGLGDHMPQAAGFDLRELHRVVAGGNSAVVYALARTAAATATPTRMDIVQRDFRGTSDTPSR